MSDDPWYHLTIAASNLKVNLPEQFDALVRAFQMVAHKENNAFLVADGNDTYRAQGRTNLAIQVVERLEQCLEKRKTYETRK